MINWKVPAGFFIVWFILTICANVIEMQDPVTVGQATVFSLLFLHEAQTSSDPSFWQNMQNVFSVGGNWLSALWDAVWFDYNFLKTGFIGQFLRYICWGFSFGFIVTFLMALFVRK